MCEGIEALLSLISVKWRPVLLDTKLDGPQAQGVGDEKTQTPVIPSVNTVSLQLARQEGLCFVELLSFIVVLL